MLVEIQLQFNAKIHKMFTDYVEFKSYLEQLNKDDIKVLSYNINKGV